MNRRHFAILYLFTAVAILIVAIGLITGSTIVKWIIPAIGLSFVSVGVGIIGLMVALDVNKKVANVGTKLVQLENLQQEIKKELQEQPTSGSTIVTSLQALTQHYTDLLSKRENENES